MGLAVVDFKIAGTRRWLTPGRPVAASRQLTQADVGKVLPVDTTAGAVVLTLTPNILAPCEAIYVQRNGGNAVTFAASGGATINNPDAVSCPNGGVMALLAHPTQLGVATVI